MGIKCFFIAFLLAFTGAQLSARIVNAIVDGTMTVESLQNEVISTTKQSAWNASLGTLGSVFKSSVALGGGAHHVSPLPMIPTFRSEDRSHVEKFVQHMARFVGEEAFALKVGQALIKRSAEVGLRVDGMVTNSGLDASKVINQPLQDVHIDKHEAFAVPLSDAIALFGAVNELTLLRRQAFEAMKSQGVSDREAMEVLNKPTVKAPLQKLAQKTEALHECEQKIQDKAGKLALESIAPHDRPTNLPPSDSSIMPNDSHLTSTIHSNFQQQELQSLLKERQTLAQEVTQTAEELKVSNRELASWVDRFKEGVDWVSHQYDQFLEHCRQTKNWAADNTSTMIGAGLVTAGLFVATLPLSGPAFAVSGGAVALTSGLETIGALATGAGLTGAGATIMMNAQHGGGEEKSKADTPSQPNPQQPQTKPGQVGDYGKLKYKSTNDGLDAHHVPHDQYMKAHGVKKDDGISMLLDEKFHRQQIHGRDFQKLDPTLTPRNALLKSVWRVKNKLIEAKQYTPEIREGLREVINKNIEKFPHLFKK